MKKFLILMIGVLIASVLVASAQQVLSANAVGYIKRTIPADGDLNVVSFALNPMSANGSMAFTNTSVAAEMDNYSWAFFWDEVTQRWSGSQKDGKGAWGIVAQGKTLVPGEMFFLQTPSGGAEKEVTITGEVPDDATLERAVVGGSAIAALGNPYPVDMAFTNLDVAMDAANYSWAYFWDTTTQRWSGSQKDGKGAWGIVAQGKTVLAGEGFFLKDEGAGSVWTNVKPYTWP